MWLWPSPTRNWEDPSFTVADVYIYICIYIYTPTGIDAWATLQKQCVQRQPIIQFSQLQVWDLTIRKPYSYKLVYNPIHLYIYIISVKIPRVSLVKETSFPYKTHQSQLVLLHSWVLRAKSRGQLLIIKNIQKLKKT